MENWVLIIVGIVVPFVVLFILGFVCWCLCKRFQKRTESKSIELQDIEHGNAQNSHILKNGLSQIQNEPQEEKRPRAIVLPLRNESRNLTVGQQKLNDLNLTLIDKYHTQSPNELFSKHIVNGKVTEDKAICLSNKRGKWFAENIGKNTVFEDPIQFHLCSIDGKHLLDAKSNYIYIPERRVRTFQCRYDPNLEDYTIEDLGMKVPILEMRDNGKYHLLQNSLDYDVCTSSYLELE